uniref:Uncharacterized protein n=1 Tax=Nelumbo nucifera TaxID=4432 RepID=A0A822YG60_NELNU|nr:TPA_asm: hypothetical protein HUJ06_010263 [Nelumbo nucifera]
MKPIDLLGQTVNVQTNPEGDKPKFLNCSCPVDSGGQSKSRPSFAFTGFRVDLEPNPSTKPKSKPNYYGWGIGPWVGPLFYFEWWKPRSQLEVVLVAVGQSEGRRPVIFEGEGEEAI